MKSTLRHIPVLLVVAGLLFACSSSPPQNAEGSSFGVEALPRMLRIDLLWPNQGEGLHYQIQRAENPEGPFEDLRHVTPTVHLFSDVLAEPGLTRFYRVRTVDPDSGDTGEWSPTVSATSTPFEREGFLTEVQEAGFRYFYHYAYPGSHLPREGIKAVDSWDPEAMSTVSTGMYFFNIAVGVERGFITREEAVAHVTVLLDFLAEKTQRFFGAYPHWIDGETGLVREFSDTDNGADTVETAILAQGLIFAREYFDQDTTGEEHIRTIADRLWKDIEWPHFIKTKEGKDVMMWHWSPDHGFSDLKVVGFHEAEIAYYLAIGSPTHPVDPSVYWTGWVGHNPEYFNPRTVTGLDGPIDLLLGRGWGKPMFTMHYSYLGLDPGQVPLKDDFLFAEFERLTQANRDYARLNPRQFQGYGKFWGLTASLSPDGYRAHHPVGNDNGTISPTAALSSIAYLPEPVIEMMCTLYLEKGETLWGPFGFYDAFNPTLNWVADGYIGIDVGPIGPMIENFRSGILWTTFMKAPEIQRALDKVWNHPLAIKE
jgi:hypothetical protein